MFYLIKTFSVISILMLIGLGLFRYSLKDNYKDVVSAKTLMLALVTPAVALFCGNVYLFHAYLAVLIAFNSRSRAELASIFVFMLPLMPMLVVETRVGSFYLFAVSAVVAMGFGALVGFLVTQNRKPIAMMRFDVAALAIVTILLLIYARGGGLLGIVRGTAVNLVLFLGPYLLVSRAVRDSDDIERLLLRLCLGGVLTAVTAAFQAGKHWILYQVYYESLRVPYPIASFTLSLRAGLLRTGGSMVDYSAGGLFLAVVLCLLALLRSRFRTTGFWLLVMIVVGGLLASQSRGAWVAAIVGLLFAAANRGAWGKVAMLTGGAVLAEAMVLLFATSGRLAAITGQTGEAAGTVSYRRLLLTRGLGQIREHPLFGQSPAELVANLSELTQGEHIVDFVNGHLFIAMSTGIPLFAIWTVAWTMPVIVAWRSRRSRRGDLLASAAVIVVTSMTALLFTSFIDRNLTWPTIALALAGPCLMVSRRGMGVGIRAPVRASRTMPHDGGAELASASPRL